MGALFLAWTAVFTVHSNIKVAALLLLVLFVAALVARRRLAIERQRPGGAIAIGIVLGWFLWHTAGAVVGDGLFHEARVRKLVHLGDLHLRTVDEFKDGGLHPGYAFPLWHGLDAFVAWFSGLDPSVVMRHEGSLLAPIAVAVAYEAGAAVFRTRAGGVTVALAQVALFCFAPGGGGSYAQLSQPAERSTPDPRAGRDRAVLLAQLRGDRGRVRRAGTGPLVVRALHARAARRGRVPRMACVPRCGCAGGRGAAVASAAREGDARAQPERRRAVAGPAAVRRPARHLRPAPLPARARGARADGRSRDRRALPLAADRARDPQALGAVRPRRLPAHPPADGGAVAVRPPVRCCVAVAGAPGGRVRAAAVRVRGGVRDRSPAVHRPSGGARRRDRLADRLAG